MIFMAKKAKKMETLEEVVQRLLNLPEEKKAELARLAGEAYGKRRTSPSS
jgi:hypothetical protein